MNSIYSYFSYFWPSVENSTPEIIIQKKFIISPSDLKKVDLTHREVNPVNSINTFELNIYDKAQLDEILSIKLKPAKVNEKPTYYPPRNPVVKQLNEKFGIGTNLQ